MLLREIARIGEVVHTAISIRTDTGYPSETTIQPYCCARAGRPVPAVRLAAVWSSIPNVAEPAHGRSGNRGRPSGWRTFGRPERKEPRHRGGPLDGRRPSRQRPCERLFARRAGGTAS